ncbi:MAG: hypothetical protein U9Q07_08195 [Planctomycetota bacterium]|nr:hypothetical protein [Planctomycetota bacterium]
MGDKQRYKRLRLLFKQLNKNRKRQAQKIDILCNDIIGTQRGFIKTLRTVSFSASFYESIVGMTDLNNLLCTAVKLIQTENPDVNVTFFLRHPESFEIHAFESGLPALLDAEHIENCFSQELMDNICKSNNICTLEDIFEMGLQGDLAGLNGVSGVTIPLGRFGSPLGFILIHRSSQGKLTADEIGNISAVTSGLSQAIACCQSLSHATD